MAGGRIGLTHYQTNQLLRVTGKACYLRLGKKKNNNNTPQFLRTNLVIDDMHLYVLVLLTNCQSLSVMSCIKKKKQLYFILLYLMSTKIRFFFFKNTKTFLVIKN